MLDRFLCRADFIGFERIEGIPYVIINKLDADLFQYQIFKIENEKAIWITHCDTKTQARKAINAIRKAISMDKRDARIKTIRNRLDLQGVDYTTSSYNVKTIYEAYTESIDDIDN